MQQGESLGEVNSASLSPIRYFVAAFLRITPDCGESRYRLVCRVVKCPEAERRRRVWKSPAKNLWSLPPEFESLPLASVGAQSAAYSRNFKQFGQGHIS